MDLPAECDDFDWDSNINSNTDFVSPIFRPCNPESPITINFDRGQAIIGNYNVLFKSLDCSETIMYKTFNFVL